MIAKRKARLQGDVADVMIGRRKNDLSRLSWLAISQPSHFQSIYLLPFFLTTVCANDSRDPSI